MTETVYVFSYQGPGDDTVTRTVYTDLDDMWEQATRITLNKEGTTHFRVDRLPEKPRYDDYSVVVDTRQAYLKHSKCQWTFRSSYQLSVTALHREMQKHHDSGCY